MSESVPDGGMTLAASVDAFPDAPPDSICIPCMAKAFAKGFLTGFVPAFLLGLVVGAILAAVSAPLWVTAALAAAGLVMLGVAIKQLADKWKGLKPEQRAKGVGQILGGITGGVLGGIAGAKIGGKFATPEPVPNEGPPPNGSAENPNPPPVSPKTGQPIPTTANTSVPPEVLADAETALNAIKSPNAEQPFPGKWGASHKNFEGNLPKTDASGDPITYKEYYLPKSAGETTKWGSNRLVVGSDGKAYVTTTHYGQSGNPPFVYFEPK